MNLRREGSAITGTWSGAFGPNQPISGTWRNGYIELSFRGIWPNGNPDPSTRPWLAGSMGIQQRDA